MIRQADIIANRLDDGFYPTGLLIRGGLRGFRAGVRIGTPDGRPTPFFIRLTGFRGSQTAFTEDGRPTAALVSAWPS